MGTFASHHSTWMRLGTLHFSRITGGRGILGLYGQVFSVTMRSRAAASTGTRNRNDSPEPATALIGERLVSASSARNAALFTIRSPPLTDDAASGTTCFI